MKKPGKKKKSKPRRSKSKAQARSANQTPAKVAQSGGAVKAAAPAPAKKEAKREAKPAAKSTGGPKVWWDKTTQFFREVKVELKKVVWPSRRETMTTTTVVIVLVLISAAFLGLIDLSLSRLIRALVG